MSVKILRFNIHDKMLDLIDNHFPLSDEHLEKFQKDGYFDYEDWTFIPHKERHMKLEIDSVHTAWGKYVIMKDKETGFKYRMNCKDLLDVIRDHHDLDNIEGNFLAVSNSGTLSLRMIRGKNTDEQERES